MAGNRKEEVIKMRRNISGPRGQPEWMNRMKGFGKRTVLTKDRLYVTI